MMITHAMERRMRRTWHGSANRTSENLPGSSNPVPPEHTPYKIVLGHTKVTEEGWIYRLGGGKKAQNTGEGNLSGSDPLEQC